MLAQETSNVDLALKLDWTQPGLSAAYTQIIQELTIVNGEKVLILYRGTDETIIELMKKNQDGHLYAVLGGENEEDQLNGWSTSNLTFIYSQLTNLPIPDKHLDRVLVVYSATLFEFKEDIIKEICRILKPGGVFDVLYFDIKEKINGYYFEIKKEDYLRNQE